MTFCNPDLYTAVASAMVSVSRPGLSASFCSKLARILPWCCIAAKGNESLCSKLCTKSRSPSLSSSLSLWSRMILSNPSCWPWWVCTCKFTKS